MDGLWQDAEGTLFEVSPLCDMAWQSEQAREQRRVAQGPTRMMGLSGRRRPCRDLVAVSEFGGSLAVLAFDEYDGDGAASPSQQRQQHGAGGERGPEHDDGDDGDDGDDDWDGELRVFTSTGKLRFSRPWLEGEVAPGGFGWIRGGLLVCVLATGDSALVFREDKSAPARVIRLPSTGDQRIACAHVWPGGFAAVTHDLQVLEGVHLQSASSYRVRVRAELSPVLLGHQAPRVVTVLRPFVAREEPQAATLAVGNPARAGLVAVEEDGTVRSQLALSDTVAVSQLLVPHPTYRLLASYGVDGVLSVLPLDFCQVLAQHNCEAHLAGLALDTVRKLVPQNMLWCGMSTFALCVSWGETPWSGAERAGHLVVSLEHRFDLLSRAHLKGSDAVMRRSHAAGDDDDDEEEGVGSGGEGGVGGVGNSGAGAGAGAGSPAVRERAARFASEGRCVTSFEVDGVRLVGIGRSELLRQVPDAVQAVHKLGATDPAAMVVDAIDMLDSGDADADASMQALVSSNKIGAAVETLLEAAEYASGGADGRQEALLRAAAYAKRFFHQTADGRRRRSRRQLAARFQDTCTMCRVARLARNEAGVAISTRQLRVLRPRVLVDRLLFLGHFFLARKLCGPARVPVGHVVAHWASAKIRQMDDPGQEADLLEALVARVESCNREQPGAVSFASIAAVAAAVGKAELAVRVGERDPVLSRRVLLLLRVQSYDAALEALRAEGGFGADPDLQMFVASDCVAGLPWERIVALCRAAPEHFSLFSRYLRSTDQNQYKQLLLALDRKRDKALVLAEESCVSLDPRQRALLMTEAAAEFKDAGIKGLSALAVEQVRLVERQNELGDRVVGLSLASTVLDCVRRGLDDEAEAFARDFGLKERTYRKIQLRGLAARQAWSRVEALAADGAVRAVLDDADFAAACLHGGQHEEAARFARQVEDAHEKKAGLLLALGLMEEALEAAYLVGNTGALESVRKRRPDLEQRVKDKMEALAKDGPPIKPKGVGKDRPALFNVARDTCAQQ